MDISNIKVGDATYSIKDSIARENSAKAITRLESSTLLGTYSETSETLTLSFMLGQEV